MTPADPNPSAQPSRRWLDRAVVFLLLVFTAITFPLPPTIDLDASWRMALGKYFLDGLQFGRDVVFTYGPLGFLMGKTYYGPGVLFWSILLWQYVSAASFAAIIMMWGERITGRRKIIYYAFFILFGVVYEDALHMLVITLAGLELIRRSGERWRVSTGLMLLLLALLSAMKFTDLLLCSAIMATAAAHEIARRRYRAALLLPGMFVACFLAIWVLCGQNPLNLPAYFRNSWIVSQGYQEAMSIPTPPAALWKALVVLGVLAAYFLANFLSQTDRVRTLASTTVLSALIFLNWKHGFVRSDGHMIGFFFCALLPIIAYPVLLADSPSFHRLKQGGLALAAVLCLLGVRDALPGMLDYSLAQFQGRIWTNTTKTMQLPGLRSFYADRLKEMHDGNNLIRTRALVEGRTIDVIGFEQAVALINGLNYQPRPVIQSYSAYTPELARLNADHLASDRAPEFLLLKIQSIDARLPSMDDSEVLRLLIHRYEYLFTERSYLLWRRKPGSFAADQLAPRLLHATVQPHDDTLSVAAESGQALWLQADLQPSLLGRLRAFFYKLPQVKLTLKLASGDDVECLMALPQGRAGFILNPLIEDYGDYMRFANNALLKKVVSVRLNIPPADRKFFGATVEYKLSTLPPSTLVRSYVPEDSAKIFQMFKNFPVTYDAYTDIAAAQIEGKAVAMLHAPSQMAFRIPNQTDTLSGQFGLPPGAYLNGGLTNGTEFVVYWSDGTRRVNLYSRYLDPQNIVGDRGLKSFSVDLQNLEGGRIYLETRPGPFNDTGWDWSCWTGIEFSKTK